MELEHAFQQSGFLVAFQLLTLASLIAPFALGGRALYHRFANVLVSYLVSFGPMAVLVYVLYCVSRLS